METHYDVLKVRRMASREEIEGAYASQMAFKKRVADQCQRSGLPGPGATAESLAQWERVNEAYNVLSDQSRREAYDKSIQHVRRDRWNKVLSARVMAPSRQKMATVDDPRGWGCVALLVFTILLIIAPPVGMIGVAAGLFVYALAAAMGRGFKRK